MQKLFDLNDTLTPRSVFMPRDYQQVGITKAFELWDGGDTGVIYRQPTGTGKTISGTMIADLWLQRGSDHRVLILAHERQLIQQFADEVEDVLRFRPAVEMADSHCKGDEKIIVGSRQTLQIKGDGDDAVSRLFKFRPEYKWLLILDECHRWTGTMKSTKHIISWFEAMAGHKRLGLTATPERSDKVSLKGLFTGIASDYRLYDIDGGRCAVNDGWAVPYDQRFIVVDGVDFKNIRTVAKDFDNNELERILGETETLAKLCDPLLDIVGKRRTIIFSPGTGMARDVALYINSRLEHEAAVSLDGSYPDDDRKAIYKRHQRGDFQFLSVCGLCREGYNDPGIQCVAVFRPTKSRSLAEQMKGRGCRPLRGCVSSDMSAEERRRAITESDKPACLIVDLVGVTGLADCPSTASIMAEGKPDEVIRRANENMMRKPLSEQSDVATEVRKAEKQIAAEKAETKLRREAELKKRQAEMDRREKLDADVRYQSWQVGHGGGGMFHGAATSRPLSPRMVSLLQWKKVPTEIINSLSFTQAGRMIGQLKSGMNVDQVMKLNKVRGPIGGCYVLKSGTYKGTRMQNVPHDKLKQMGLTNKDPEFQANIAKYRVQWRELHPKGK